MSARYLRDVEVGAVVAVAGAPEMRAKVMRRAQTIGGLVMVRTLKGKAKRTVTVKAGTKDEHTVTFEHESGKLTGWSGGTRVEVQSDEETESEVEP